MCRIVAWEKIFVEDKTKNLPVLCKIGNTLWKQNMVAYLREKELAILRRAERAMCEMKMMNRKKTNEQMDLLELDNTMDKANGVRWYGYVLRREDGNVLRKALEFKSDEQKKEKDQR